MALTKDKITALKPRATPFYVSDDLVPGLQLRVAPDGRKTWSVRYRIGGRQRRLTLGNLSVLPLNDNRETDPPQLGARTLARQAVQRTTSGIDPAELKRERREAQTVADFAKVYIDEWAMKKKKSWKADRRQLEKQVLPRWRHRLVKDITRKDVRALVEAIAKRGAPIVANRVLGLLSKFFNVAIEHDLIEHNPATGVRRPGVEHQRDRVLSHEEIRKFWTACDALDPVAATPWKLRLLSAQRGGEIFSMQWEDVDLKQAWWTIPSASAKNKKSHRVPLSPPALALLTALHTEGASGFVFAGARGKHQQSAGAATFKLENFVGHDLRRTAASLMAGSGVPRLVVSKILNHVETGVTAVYDRHGYDPEKRTALDAWARTLTGILEDDDKANVLPFVASA